MANNPSDGYGLADEPDDPPRRTPSPRQEERRPRPKKAKAVKRPVEEAEDERTPVKGPPKPPSPLVLLAVLVPLIGFVVLMAVRQANNKSAAKDAFAAEMDQLVRPATILATKASPGKLAIIDPDKRELHYLHERNGGEGADRQAATPSEAATIVHIRTTNRLVREYPNGRKGVKQSFVVTVIDKATWGKLGEKTFEGGDPPDSISLKRGGGTDELVAGELPFAEIYDSSARRSAGSSGLVPESRIIPARLGLGRLGRCWFRWRRRCR